MMKTCLVLVLVIVSIAGIASAAPVESVESARASVALQKVDAFLSEQIVAEQLQALGMTPEQARARLNQLSKAQLEQIAAQIDLVQAGGTIQGGNPRPLGPLGCVLRACSTVLYNLYQVIFCWGDIK
jgi:Flp pilus assembly protein TadB